MNSGLHRLAAIAAIIAFCVIVLGAYVRLSHAGLGCPDWPGCYGQLTWPVESQEVLDANQQFPERPVESDKAWKEMVHRTWPVLWSCWWSPSISWPGKRTDGKPDSGRSQPCCWS